MVSLYAEPWYLLGIVLAKLLGIKSMLWVEITFDSWVPRKRWKERIKILLFPRVDGIVTPGSDGRAFSKQYGALDSKIFEARHSIDVKFFVEASKRGLAERHSVRNQHELSGVVFVYVGRLWSGKGLDYLLDAYAKVQAEGRACNLLLLGDGPEESRLKERCKQEDLRGVVFAGFQQHSELPRLLSAADVMVFPTLGDPYGLVVDEAMACGLPIISTTAAGEIHLRVSHGENGYLVQPANSAQLSEKMVALLHDPRLRQSMGQRSRQLISQNTPEAFAIHFEEAVFKVLADSNRYGN